MRSKTRLSLFYLASYLTLGGIAMLAAPTLALKLLFATGDYGTVFPRMGGMFMISLGAFVAGMIYYRVAVLYPLTLLVRAFLLVCVGAFYASTGDPFFVALIAVIGLGFITTGTCLILDRRAPQPGAPLSPCQSS